MDDLREGYQIDFLDRNVEIEIYGLAEDLDNLTVNVLRPILDVGGLAAGRHVRPLQLTLDEEKYVVGETSVSFTIRSEESDTGNPDASDPDENDPDAGGAGTDSPDTNGTDGDTPQDTAADTEDGQEGDADVRDTMARPQEPDQQEDPDQQTTTDLEDE